MYIETLNEKIDNLNGENITQESVDNVAQELCNLCINPAKHIGICKELKKCKPNQKKYPCNNKPWFDTNCHDKRKEYIRVKNSLKKVEPIEKMIQLQQHAKAYKQHIKRAKKAYTKELHKKLRNLKNTNPKEYWDMIGNKDKGATSCRIALETFQNFFAKLSKKPESDQNNEMTEDFDPREMTQTINEDINVNFTLSEVQVQIRKLKNRKACGIDNIINEFLKNCPTNIVEIVVKLFNIVLQNGVVPESWCIGMIKPLYKNKGSADDPDNYRGITLLSCIAKLVLTVVLVFIWKTRPYLVKNKQVLGRVTAPLTIFLSCIH